LNSRGVVMSINEVFMEAKRAEPSLKNDKNALLSNGKKLCIFNNLFLLIYWPKIRENLRVGGRRCALRYAFGITGFLVVWRELWFVYQRQSKMGQSGTVCIF